MKRVFAQNKVGAIVSTGLLMSFMALLIACGGEEKTSMPPDELPQAELETKAPEPAPAPEPPAEEGLTGAEQENLAKSLEAEAAEEITAENAEAIADALEKEIAADLE